MARSRMTAVEGYAVAESSVVAPLRVPGSGRQRRFDVGRNSVNEAEIQLPPAAWHNRRQIPSYEIAACQLSMNTGFRRNATAGVGASRCAGRDGPYWSRTLR